MTYDQRRLPASDYNRLVDLDIRRPRSGHRGIRGGKRNHQNINQQQEGHTNGQLKVGLINCQSSRNKSDLIIDHLKDHDLDLLALTETWLKENDSVAAGNITPAGFSLISVPREHRRGGGVALLHKSSLHVKAQGFGHDKPRSFEITECDLSYDNATLKLAIVYRPPPSSKNRSSFSDFIQEFSSLLDKYVLFTGKLLILGDFNVHWENENSNETSRLMSLLHDHNLQQHVVGPTHESGHTLDLVIGRVGEECLETVEIGESLSDHSAIHCKLHLRKPKAVKRVIQFRKIKAIDSTTFSSDIEKSELSSSDASLTAETLLHKYNVVMGELLDRHAPQRSCVIIDHPAIPWYNQEIADAKRKRRQLERKWRRTGLSVDKQLFKDQRNLTKELFKVAKSEFWNDLIMECGSDQKALYGIISQLLHQKTSASKKMPQHLTDDDLAVDFSRFFVGKIEKIRECMPATQVLPNGQPSRDCDAHLTLIHPTCPEEVKRIIHKTSAKTCSLDPVPTVLVKQHGDLLALHISCLINASLRDGVFPDCLKLAYVTPVLKKSSLDHNDLANYRPVSNLPFLAKVTEKIVASRLTAYLQGNDLHECLQSAYRKNHSVETALLKVSDDILTSIDCRKAAALVLLDLSAAFDTIDHAVLLERLREDFGIEATALQWFESYLNDRRQAVVINGKLSPETTLSYGVPQGSVLGPLLFTLYITPLGSIIQRHGLSAHFYADDTQLYLTFDPKVGGAEERAAAAISAAIEEIRCWMRRNFLKLNEKKTEYLLLSSPHMGNKITGTPILVGEEAVSPNNKARNLGVVFDRTMSMKDHISRVCQSAFYHLRRIAEIRHCLTRSAAENLIHALITSRLDFCNSLLVGLPSSAIKRLQAVQNAAARLLMGIRKFDHISPTLHELHWLPVHCRVQYKILLLAFKALHNLSPGYVSALISVRQLRPGLRCAGLVLQVPSTRLKTYGDRAFSSSAPHLWNSLPVQLRNCNNIDTFKSELKTYLFRQHCE